jgi:hypothetical protein
MKAIIKRSIVGDERGAGVLILALILLVVGGLILTPLLGFMGTGLMSGQVYEKKTEELYAADAGWADALWRIQDGSEVKAPGCPTDPTSWNYTISDVNGKDVAVNITHVSNVTGSLNYRILSIATTPDTGSSTTVESYVELVPGIELNILGGALVSRSDITLGKELTVNGDVFYCGDLTYEGSHQVINGTLNETCPVPFPTPDEDSETAQAFKDRAMAGEPPHEDDMVHIDDDGNVVVDDDGSASWGPTYIAGNLTIGARATITLGGVLYVEGWINWRDDCYHGDKEITITGTGSVVAGGDICFGSLADYTLTGNSVIMSLNGDIVLEKETEGDVIVALIYAPNGHIDILKHFSVHGQVVGNSVSVQDSSYTYVPVGGSDSPWDLPGGRLYISGYNVS